MQKVTVTVEMMDGTIHEDIRIVLKDMIRFSETAARHNWPSMEEDAIRFAAFVAYAAMCRLGLFDPHKGFDEFTDEVAMVTPSFGDEVDPTKATTPVA